ncbi:DnaJ-domain-containing protein [Punctularia strigosozonata HHB-11173 SS5]|uniref:DnaJ-domain-containing protein n=1 Tax=Punctularia strigosozonata (strain HHB-11173) TaxID=741275 RepID=UPI0004418628|nr:DnaJ-domain-containing protein [Punctularia strigosozonata HHB-11173 SS5]EIN10462.1 DnaJ-domain-containing protein [Punctularia strigosozonata HHB-11173 SS5]
MRLLLWVALVAIFATSVYAWTKEDHEIFDLVSAVEASEGKGTTFYSWLGVPSTASTAEIGKAYRKKSMQLHPDKNPGVKGAQERFARLGVVAALLRNAETRERYNFFYKNGVPKWRGTGYYYSRFRPGLFTVLVFLTLLTSALHYLVQRMNYKRDLAIVERTLKEARQQAWGTRLAPPDSSRKVKVNLGGQPRLDENGNVVGGKVLDMVVQPNGDVFIYQPDGDLIPVDTSAATPPSIRRTWFVALLTALFAKATGKSGTAHDVASAGMAEKQDDSETDDVDSDVPGSGSVTPSYDSERPESSLSMNIKGGRLATSKAGGKRRKTVRKR